MNLSGKYFREHTPWIYNIMVSLINWIKRVSAPYYIYITDSLGGSFKDYFTLPDIQDRIRRLKRNLDKESSETIDIIMVRLQQYPDEKDRHRMSRRIDVKGGRLPVETREMKDFLKGALKLVKRKTGLPSRHIGESVFFFEHGLRLFPAEVNDYIKDSDFIDAGAYIGDSAIALKEYGYRKIFSIEISRKSIEKYKINLERNGIDPTRYLIINSGISAVGRESPVTFPDTGSAGLSVLRRSGKYDIITVERDSIDNIVREFNIMPRFIKADIEGSALDLIKGAITTIKKFRPVLSIAIYHNPVEFFEVKPFLEELMDDYVFFIRKLSSGIKNNECHSEVILLGCPGEVLKEKPLKPLSFQDL